MPQKPLKKQTKPVKSVGRTTPEISKVTAVRNTAIPKPASRAAVAKPAKTITREQIAERAYFISQSGTGGTQDENWHRAERELRNGI